MDPLSALGISIGSMALGDTLKEIAGDSAKDFAKDLFKERLKDWSKATDKSALERAALQALKEFLRLFEEEIDSTADFSFIGDALKRDLKKFLSNENVRALLGRPFDPDIRQIESGVLSGTWEALKLTPLPKGFGWDKLGQQYVRAVRRIQREQGSELRAVLNSQNMEATRKAVEATAGVEKDPDLNKYKESLRKAYGYLKLEALDPGFDHRMQLWRVFVPQRVSKGIPERELPKDFAKPEHAASALLAGEILGGPSEPEPVLEVLDRDANRLTVVVGDPGSGKSTLVQYLCLRWAQENRRELPILVELRKYASDKNAPRDFLSYLYSGASTIWQFDQHQLDDKLKAGDALVIFDGLDEVVDRAQRETVITEIIRFSAQYNHPQIIITSRITGYQRARLSDAGFQHFTLQDFDDNEIKTFIEKWHQIAFSNPDDRTRLNHRLRESISGSQRIRELASNPLLLTLMAILNRNQKLPDERWELYARASEILLGKWDLGKFLTSEPGRDSISLKEKLGMLRSIAKYMQASPEGLKTNLIHRDQLEGVLVLYLGSLGDVQHPRALARLMMDELRERNFVLCFSEDEFYSFVHRTFLEYFCAQYFRFSVVEDQTLTMHDLRTLFLTHWEDDSWKEVLHLIVGMIGLPRSKDLTECLLDHPLQGSGQAMALAFAAECFAEIVERAKVPELAQRLRSAIAGLRDSAFGFPLFIAVASAVNVWGPDEDNRQLVLSATKATRKRNERRIGLYLWAYNWPNDPDLASFMGRLITADDVMDDLMGRTEILHEGLED